MKQRSTAGRPACPGCGDRRARHLFAAKDLPWSSVGTRLKHFRLARCAKCSLVYQSSAFSPAYRRAARQAYAAFDNSATFPFPDRARNGDALALILKELPDRPGLNILEIGSNRGDLLYLLKEARPSANVIGVEPTQFRDLRVPTLQMGFRAGLFATRFDAIVMKHVLEHMERPTEAIKAVRDQLIEGGLLYVEVPDLELGLEHQVEDYYPEHISYFTERTLVGVLEGFEIIAVSRDPFLSVIARRSEAPTWPPRRATAEADLASQFRTYAQAKRALCRSISAHSRAGGQVIFFGASFYFRRLYQELAPLVDPATCAYLDDNLHAPREPAFGVARAPHVEPGAMIVICSNNFRVQQSLERRLAHEYPTATIVRPWLSAIRGASA